MVLIHNLELGQKMEMKIIKNTISKEELEGIAKEQFGDLVKAVIDTEKEIMAVGGELYADEEALLIGQEGSQHEHIWGINLYPKKTSDEWIEFDSVINLKPSFGNRSRGVDNPEIQKKIRNIIEKLVSQ